MSSLQPLTKKYYKQTKSKIPALYPNKKDILNQIHSSLLQYESEHTEFTYDDLIENFGEPSEFANSLIEFDSPDGIRRRLFDTKKIIILCTISLATIAIFIFIAMILVMKHNGDRATEMIITIEEESNSQNNVDTNQTTD